MLLASPLAWPDESPVQLEVKRDGTHYQIAASIATTLSPCAAYAYLTDHDAAKQLPGVIESHSVRESADKVRVDRTADEKILFFRVRLHSVLEYTERARRGVSFVQISGDSKRFQGTWEIEPTPQGSTFHLRSEWEPDTAIPLFIIDYFARSGLAEKFNFMAQLAEKRKDELTARCEPPQLTATVAAGNASPHD